MAAPFNQRQFKLRNKTLNKFAVRNKMSQALEKSMQEKLLQFAALTYLPLSQQIDLENLRIA